MGFRPCPGWDMLIACSALCSCAFTKVAPRYLAVSDIDRVAAQLRLFANPAVTAVLSQTWA